MTNDIIEKKIILLNCSRYGAHSTHLTYVDCSSEDILVKDKFKGHIIRELFLGSQDIFSVINDSDILNMFTIKYVKGRRWNSGEILSIKDINEVDLIPDISSISI